MTDKERREDEALKNCIQAAYDFSDEQLLAELEETEATLSDSDFPGIEDRIYQKMMARIAEEEAAEAVSLEAVREVEDKSEIEPKAEPVVAEEKVVRFRKKKVFVVGLLAAAFVGMLGVTAIGGKNYFFRDREKEIGIAINNDRNLEYTGDIDEAYKKI
ncbi:MAG: hypothetical protein IJ374_10500, partial [Lachnospiraceae bacterium]|nr:hypothetical protein [Lachnospiraceae bacterium]